MSSDKEFVRFPSNSDEDDIVDDLKGGSYSPDGTGGALEAGLMVPSRDSELKARSKKRRRRLKIFCGVGWGVFAIVSLVGYFVIAPHIAQNLLDQGKMSVLKVEMGKVYNNKREGAVVELISTFSIDTTSSPFDTVVSPEGSTQMFYKSKHFADVGLSAMKLKKRSVMNITTRANMTVRDIDTFSRYGKDLTQNATIEWRMLAPVKVTPTILGISLPLSGLKLDKTMNLTGLDGLQHNILKVFTVSLDKGMVHVDLKVEVNNPSIAQMDDMGDLAFNIFYEGAVMGKLHASNVPMPLGSSIISMGGGLAPSSMRSASRLFSRYMHGLPTLLSAIAPSANASSIPVFDAFLTDLHLKTTLEGVPHGLVKWAQMSIDLVDMLKALFSHGKMSIPTSLFTQNPFGAEFDLHAVNLDVYFFDKTQKKYVKIGNAHSDKDMTGKPLHIRVPGNSAALGVPVGVDVIFKGNLVSILRSIYELFKGGDVVMLGMAGTISTRMGNLDVDVTYAQAPFPTCLCVMNCRTEAKDYGVPACRKYRREHPNVPIEPAPYWKNYPH